MTNSANRWVLVLLNGARARVLCDTGWEEIDNRPSPRCFRSNRLARQYAIEQRISRSVRVLSLPSEDGRDNRPIFEEA